MSKEILLNFDLNQKQIESILKFKEILINWSSKMNLISKSTLESIDVRHIANSLQLLNFYKHSKNLDIVDLGTGAGFPGLVLGIVDDANNYYLIDSNKKKCSFLNYVINQLGVKNIKVISERAENVDIKADIVTSRAMSSLISLCQNSLEILKNKSSYMLFLKGSSLNQELSELEKSSNLYSKVSHETFEDKFLENSFIIKINLRHTN